MTVDSKDYYLDLLFYHRRLAGWSAWSSSSGRSRPATRGRWNSTSKWLERYEWREGERGPMG